MRCLSQDQTLSETKSFEVTDPLDAIKQTMEWRNLSWVPMDLHAHVFQVHMSEFAQWGLWDITLHAMYENNRQTYVLTVRA